MFQLMTKFVENSNNSSSYMQLNSKESRLKKKLLTNSIDEKIIAKINIVEKFFFKLKNEQIKVTKP